MMAPKTKATSGWSFRHAYSRRLTTKAMARPLVSITMTTEELPVSTSMQNIVRLGALMTNSGWPRSLPSTEWVDAASGMARSASHRFKPAIIRRDLRQVDTDSLTLWNLLWDNNTSKGTRGFDRGVP